MGQSNSDNIQMEEKESNIIQQIIGKYLPYWPLLIVFVLISLSAGYAFLRYATPVYEAAAKIIIKDDRRGGDDSKIMESLNLIASNKVIENEIEVLQSRALMEDVVNKLFLYAPISQKGKVKKSDAYLLSPIIVEVRNTDSMIEIEKVNFNFDKNTQSVLLEGKDRYPINQFVNTQYGVLRFTLNEYYSPSLESNKQLSFSLENPSNIAAFLIKGLAVASAKQSAIVDITFKDIIPQRAANILNTLVSTYAQKSIEEKNILSRNTLSFINERLALLGKDLDSIEKKVQQFKSGSNAVNIGDQGSIFLQNVASTDQQLGEINTQSAVLNQVEKYIANKAGEGGMVPSTLGVEDPTLSALLNKLYTSELEYDKLKKTVGENNPKMIAMSEEMRKIRPNILDNLKSQQASLGAKKQSLYATSNGFSSMLRAVPKKERQLLDISREQQTKNNLFQYLLQKKEESELSYASTLSNSRVVDKALAPTEPISPKSKLIYMVAIAGALGLFAGVVILKDSFTGKIKYRNEIEKMTSIPIIGEIAFEKSDSPLVIEKGTRSFVAEEFRKLRISLSFLGIDHSHKKLLITSSISGEGKSFIAANLAVSLSLTGKKVVLVDLDLNNPSLSKILKVNYENGVTEFLTDEKNIDEIINKVDTHENLYFISAGSLPENPTELLANGKVQSLIEYLENKFDMVVIDTSPAVLVTDAYILSGMCDATLYVIRHNYTPKMLIKRIDETNQINPINNPAIIFNGVKTRGVFKNNYGYGYDYVYGNKERGKKAS
jgi:capsular exopolysaccharide synthesis family protein